MVWVVYIKRFVFRVSCFASKSLADCYAEAFAWRHLGCVVPKHATNTMCAFFFTHISVPFLSGLSSRKVGGVGGGGGGGVGIDASTVAVINEICARALQSDVASAIAAALAASGAVMYLYV